MAKPRKKSGHPWVMAAFFCESTIEGKDNVISAIRIVDRFFVKKPANWNSRMAIGIKLHGLVAFKADKVVGTRRVKLVMVPPKGGRKKIFETAIEFMGGTNGANIRLNIGFGFNLPGTYWQEVYVDDWLATRMPLTIEWEETPSESPKQ
jgi:hypothetical protein